MSLSDIAALNQKQAAILELNGWTIEKLATATIKELTDYKGIGKVTAEKAIFEALNLVNTQKLVESEELARERYYQKAPAAKILEDWAEGGLSIQDVALSSARALAALKGIADDLALRLISTAQDEVNRLKLYESRVISPGVAPKETSPAFPAEWLTGEVKPPPMSVRVRANFERAKEAYEAQ